MLVGFEEFEEELKERVVRQMNGGAGVLDGNDGCGNERESGVRVCAAVAVAVHAFLLPATAFDSARGGATVPIWARPRLLTYVL